LGITKGAADIDGEKSSIIAGRTQRMRRRARREKRRRGLPAPARTAQRHAGRRGFVV
jgi:hypothetical protein